MFSPDRYVDAMRFAAAAHNAQKEQCNDLPYLVHVVSVSAEVIAVLPFHPELDADLAVTCALLHDTVEDTKVTVEDIAARYGDRVAAGVSALSKNGTLAKPDRIPDCLRRIKEQPREVAIVKLADRTINMSAPPHDWSKERCANYRVEAQLIVDTLGYASPVLEARLRTRIDEYEKYCR